MEHSPSSEANSSSASYKFPTLLGTQRFITMLTPCLSLVCTLGQTEIQI